MKILAPHRGLWLDTLSLPGKKVVEIGVWEGDYSALILRRGPACLWLVDPWRAQNRKVYYDHMNRSQDELDAVATAVYRRFRDNIRVRILRLFSLQAAAIFKPESLDLVYVDANHTYKACLEDIDTWYPLVRRGGRIAGHDYTGGWKDVERAVGDFLHRHGLELEGVTGEPQGKTWVVRKP